ncbi:MAG: TonB-dependent receptor plug domain-containing protein, partial [Acetobacteraceae bacterium]
MKGHSRQLSRTKALLLAGLGLVCVVSAHASEASSATADSAAAVQGVDPALEPISHGGRRLKEVVVTGTLIPTDPDAAAVPVTTLDASQLQQTGVATDTLSMLRKAIPAFAGRSNAGNSNAQGTQFTAGGSQIQLRNLPTLVLVNGERLAIDAVGGLKGKNFVDISAVPAVALQRVDVLTDGASSLYGSDAIGGVVNFILKHDYHGLSFGGRYGAAAGDYRERSAFVTGGADVGPVNITATASYSYSSPLWQDARSFASPYYGATPATTLPGVVGAGSYALAPGLLAPNVPTGTLATAGSYADLAAAGVYNPTTSTAIANGFDISPYQMLLQQQEVDSFVSNVTSKSFFDDRVKAFGDIMVSRNKADSTAWHTPSQPFAAASGLTVPAGSPYDPLTTAATGVTLVNPALPKRVADITDAYRVTAGLKGKLWADWTWQSTVNYSESKLTEDDLNLLFKPNIALAIAGGYAANGNPLAGGAYSRVYGGYSINNPLVLQPAINPFARGVTPAQIANLYGTEVLHADSKLYSWDAHAVGSLFSVPAGKVELAAGLNWRREQLSGNADPNGRNTDPVTGLQSGDAEHWLGGTYLDPFTHGRQDGAVYAETRVPVTSAAMHLPGLHQFEIVAAARFEHYSDAGSSTVPKFGFRWEPFDDQLVFRGTYAKSFSAPTLYAEYGPTDTRQAGGAIITGVFGNNYQNMPFNAEDGNNPNLVAATSVSRSIGLTFRPKAVNGLSVDADFSSINLYGFAGGIGFNNVLQSVNALGSASPYFNNLAVGNFTTNGGTNPFTTPGALQTFLTDPVTAKGDPAKAEQLYLIDRFTNLAVLQERSWTMGATYILPWTNEGTWTLSTNGAIFDSFKFQALPNTPFIQYAGTTNNAGATGGFGGTMPTYRFYSTVDWAFQGLDVTVANNYVSSTMDTGQNGTSPPIPVSSYSAWDLRGAYDWRPGDPDSDRKITFALGANNVGNAMPPFARRAFANQDTNGDVGTFSPIGRFVYA